MNFKKIKEAFEVTRNIENGSFAAKKMTNIVHAAHKFESSIVLHTQNRTIDVKSFLGLSVSLIKGSEYTLEIHGDDEEEAKKEMIRVFSEFGIKVKLK